MPDKRSKESESHDKIVERFDVALWATKSAIWDWDIEKNILWRSPGNQRLFGRGGDEITENFGIEDFDETWGSHLHPDDRARVLQCLRDHLANDTPYDVEYRYCLPSGDYIWLHSVGRALRDSNGMPLRMVGSNEDISERKVKEGALYESEERFKRIFLGGSLGVSIFGLDSRFLSVNQEFRDMLGYGEEELVGRTFAEITHPDDIDVDSDLAAELFAEEIPSYQIEKRFLSKAGEIVWVQMTGSIVRNEQGEPLYGMGMFQNITQHKASAEKLRVSEARLAEAQRIAQIGSWTWVVADHLNHWSDELYRIYGVEPGGMNPTQEDFMALVHPEDRASVDEVIKEVLKNKTPYDIEHRIVRPDSEIRVVHGRGEVEVDQTNKPIRMTGTIQDITERQRADEVLRESEQKLRGIFETAAIGITATDGKGRYIQSNPAFQRMLGLTAEELSTKTFWDITHPDDHHLEKPKYAELTAGRIASYQIDKRYLHKSGSTIWANLNVSSLKGANGTIIGTIATIEDITERRRDERALAQSESRLAEAQQLANIGNWEYHFGTRKMVWSDHMLRLYGLDSNTGKLTVEIFLNIVHPDDRAAVKQTLREQELPGGQHNYDHRIVLPDGEVRFIQERVEQILDDSGSLIGARGTTQDITERVQAEEQLRQAQKMEAVGQLTGGVAHDFNNLLGVILGNLDLLDDKLENDDERHAYVERSINAVERAATLTHRLLAFSRKQTLSPVVADVNKLLTGMSDLLTRTLGETVSVRFELANNIWRTLVDENQLEAAVLNLAINARDAMPSGGKLTLESAAVELDQAYAEREGIDPGDYVMIAVSDTGDGIPADMLDHVFEPFYTTKEVGQGSGLGLSMVFGFLKQSGGHAKIYSEEGRGTTAKLYLPRTRTEHASELDQSEPIVERGTGQVILVVEDDTALLATAEVALSDLGYVALSATDAKQALELLDANPDIELLFTDVVLPGGVNGVELSREALRRRPELKILFTSGYTANAIVHHGVLDPGVKLMDKPYRKADLGRRMALLLGKN